MSEGVDVQAERLREAVGRLLAAYDDALELLAGQAVPYFGDDVAANLVPLCPDCHDRVTRLEKDTVYLLLWKGLRDDEYAYAFGKCGEDFWEHCYRIEYVR